MKEVNINAPAKINLYLEILGRRKDGFHTVETVMQAVNLFDQIKLKERVSGIKLLSSHPHMAKGKSNLAYQAAELFLKKTGLKKGVTIELKKNIPVGAGLGGGSSDGAAVLQGLNKLWKLKLSKKKLIRWAKELGSDVPFFIEGKTAYVSGRGEKVKPLKIKKRFCFLLFFPGFSLSTAKVYRAFSKDKNRRRKRHIKKILCALKYGDLKLVREYIYNGLGDIVFKIAPRIQIYRKRLLQAGLEPVNVCGSGSSLFVPIKDIRQTERLIKKLKLREGVYIVQSLA